MKLILVRYTCANCFNVFDAPEISPGFYGEFLLRSPSGEMAHLDALKDNTYSEVSNLLAGHKKVKNLSRFDRTQLLRRIYGEVACDKDIHGDIFTLGAPPFCPICKNRKMASWEFTQPPEFVNINVPHVTHTYWNTLSESDKLIFISKYI